MPAQVVVVHEDAAETIARAIQERGYTVGAYSDPLRAMSVLEHVAQIELLITRVRFAEGRSNGRSLALMVRQQRPSVLFLFLCDRSDHEHVAELGDCLPIDASASRIADFAQRLLPP